MKQVIIAKMQVVVDGCMGDAPPYCQAYCPMHTKVREYVGLIGKGKFNEAIAVIREKLFLPATLGRICAHPCEDSCKRGELNHPLSIAALKRFVSDNFDDQKLWNTQIESHKPQKIVIIGAGPAGAQAAIDLALKGYKVRIFEKHNFVGGMMRAGIPEYRLPRNIIDFEYSLLEKLGVEIKLGTEVGKDISLRYLRREYDAVVIAVGMQSAKMIHCEGHKLPGVFNAVEFLLEVSNTRAYPKLGKKVVVIGGGNVALDVARSAVRLGDKEITLFCVERDHNEMPAHNWEIDEALEEGVKINPGWGIVKIEGSEKITGITLKKCISVFGAERRFNPQYDENQTITIEADSIIFAIGQKVDNSFDKDLPLTPAGMFAVDPTTLQVGNSNIFVAGDASGHSVIVISAMAEGRKAAISIDRMFNKKDMIKDRQHERAFKTWLETKIPENIQANPRLETKKIPVSQRISSFDEVDKGFTLENAVAEGSRCLHCECRLCVKECVMLKDYAGLCPKTLFAETISAKDVAPLVPYSCNMCKTCTMVCPKHYNLSEIFMDMRKEMVESNQGESPMKGHKAINIHQKLGFSNFFNIVKPAKTRHITPESKVKL